MSIKKIFTSLISLFALSAMLCIFSQAARTAQKPELTNVNLEIPGVIVAIPYATEKNFTGVKLYTNNLCLLRPAVAQALEAANEEAMTYGYRFLMLDCYRPKSVSMAMWAAGEEHNKKCRTMGSSCKRNNCDPAQPDCLWEPLTNYVSRNSKHNRGAAVDLTLITLNGYPVNMGTPFDFFGPEAHTKNATGKALKNRMLLKRIMANHGFSNYFREWWHYNHNSYKRYGSMDIPLADYVTDDSDDSDELF